MPWWKPFSRRASVVTGDYVDGVTSGGRSLENPAVPLSDFDVVDYGGHFAGVTVNAETMLLLPVVRACVAIISDTLASVSLNLADATTDEIDGASALHKILHDKVNPELSSLNWRRLMFRHVLIEGDHFSRLEWDNANRLKAIYPLDPRRMRVEVRDGKRLYVYQLLGGGLETYGADDILHLMFEPDLSGLRSRKPWRVMKEAIALGLAMQRYGAKFFENGGHPALIVSQPGLTSPDAKQRAANSIAGKLRNLAARAAGVLVLDGGQKADVVSTDPRSGQFLESRQQQVEEICRGYGVPPAMVQHYQGGGLPRSVEFLGLLFEKHCIRPWAEIAEAEFALKIAQPGRKIVFDLSDLQRGDFKTRVEAVSRGVQAGVFTPNDGRKLFSMPRLDQPGADDLYLQQNMAAIKALPGAPEPDPNPDGDPNP